MAEAWSSWHHEYDEPHSPLAIRLAIVQDETRQALAHCTVGPIQLVSVGAGQGRDVVAALDGHPRRTDVTAVLVELDADNVAAARRRAATAGLANVSVVQADASLTDLYAECVPADVLLICGIFGHISDVDIRRTIRFLPHLCAPEASVIWTRHLGPRDGSANLTPTIRRWFAEAGFEEVTFRHTAQGHGIGVHRLATAPKPYEPGRQLFTFVEPST